MIECFKWHVLTNHNVLFQSRIAPLPKELVMRLAPNVDRAKTIMLRLYLNFLKKTEIHSYGRCFDITYESNRDFND